MLKIIATAAVLMVGGWAGYTAIFEGNLESPAYTLIKKKNNIEIREYQRFRVAKIAQEKGRENLKNGFRALAGYIFGGNSEEKSMAMTAPVMQENMLQGMNVSFFMSAKEGVLPTPNNGRVTVQEEYWGKVASITFRGSGKEERFQKYEAQLRSWLQNTEKEPRDSAINAQYNSPMAFPFMRRNEVLIPLKN